MIKNVLAVLMLTATPACAPRARTDREALQGVVEFDERLLGFEVAGRLRELHVDRGDRVSAGTLIARIDDSLERPARAVRLAELQAAQSQLSLLRAGSRSEEVRGTAAELRAAQAAEQLLEQRLERQRSLTTRGVAPPSTAEDLERQLSQAQAQREAIQQRLALVRHGARSQEVEAAEARVAAANAALASVDAQLSRYELRALGPGTVLDVHIEAGEMAAPTAPVVTVGDTTHPYVDVFVPQAELHGIRVGVAAAVRIDAEARPFHGRIESVGRSTEFTPRFLFSERERPNLVVRVRVRVDDPQERLHAGVPAFVTLVGGGRP
jgi:multidrug resistance efflux pump